MRQITIRVPDPSFRNIAVSVLLLGGLLYLWLYSTRTSEPEHFHAESESGPGDKVTLTPEAQKNARIESIEIRPTALQEWLETTGVVEPDLNRIVRVRPLSKGVVRRVLVHPGDRVAAGQVLFEYDNIELGEIAGEYKRLVSEERKLLARAEVARQAADRAERLFAAQALAQKDVELRLAEQRETQAELDAHRANMNALERKLQRFGRGNETVSALASSSSSVERVRATQPGIVLDFEIAPGETLASEQDVMTIANLQRVWMVASVYEKDLGRVKTGRRAEASFNAFPGKKFFGEVTQIGSRLDPATRTAMVRVELDNPADSLRLEMFGTVRLPTEDPRTVPAVPATALQQIDGKDSVFVQLSANEFQKRTVELGHKSAGWVEILGGVRSGERVVTKGSFYLKSTLLKETLSEDH